MIKRAQGRETPVAVWRFLKCVCVNEGHKCMFAKKKEEE